LQQPIFGDVLANEQTSLSRVADREELPLLLDKARQFAGQYIDSLEERPVFPKRKIPASNACFARTVELVPVDDQGRMRDYQMPKLDEAGSWNLGSNLNL